jgi:hypothetical protein
MRYAVLMAMYIKITIFSVMVSHPRNGKLDICFVSIILYHLNMNYTKGNINILETINVTY